MSAGCCDSNHCHDPHGPYRRILIIALLANAVMFAVEVGAGLRAGSLSLLADSLDFLGDAANYGVSLWVLRRTVVVRARASLLKAASMGGFGLWIAASAIWHAWAGEVPEARTMGLVGMLALMVNAGVAALLYTYRDGDSNMRSVWLCSRNDALGNVAVMLAAAGVFGTGMAWPDLLVALIMSGLALSAAWHVSRRARAELAVA